jgi:hypothetical protein
MECINSKEYSNSCPHFKQTWYVRFLIVNTLLRWPWWHPKAKRKSESRDFTNLLLSGGVRNSR